MREHWARVRKETITYFMLAQHLPLVTIKHHRHISLIVLVEVNVRR